MSSSASPSRNVAKTIETWNRKLHYYLGLYFLFFLWLFALTGLMLNHQQWFRNLYDRAESRLQLSIETPLGDTVLEQASDVMRQLGLQGEIDFPANQPVWHIDFSVSRPNGAAQVRVDLTAKKAYIREFENGRLHAFQIFHTFSGSRFNQPASQRDWIVTSLWVWAMDALALGLIVMVLGSYYMWWKLKKRKALGVAVLTAGLASCAIFVTGLV
jgi:hypothetical protein